MSSWETWLIIILVIGVILSNLMVLKHSAKFKLPQFGKKTPSRNKGNNENAEEDDK